MRIKPKHILCAIDFSDFTQYVLNYGKSLATEFGSKLYICHVVPRVLVVSSHMPAYIDCTGIEEEHMAHAREKISEMTKNFTIDYEILVSTGNPPDEIAAASIDHQIDMVVAATHGGSGIKRFLIGSVTSRLVKILTCPLLVLHSQVGEASFGMDEGIELKRILVGCDFSSDSQLAFDYALSLAQEFQTGLHLAHVIKPIDQIRFSGADYAKIQEGDYTGWSYSEYLDLQRKSEEKNTEIRKTLYDRLERRLMQMVPEECCNWCTPKTVLLEGHPFDELILYAQQNEIDMIVLGIHGHSLLEQFLVGSTTDRVISRAPCPVLAVRQSIA